jgi:hypothetical protein
MTDAPRPTLADLGACVYVTLSAARAFARAGGYGEHEIEAARRELTELLLDARQSASDPSRWRARKRSTDLDITAIVAREGRLYVVTSVSARGYDPPSRTSGVRR